MNICKHFFSYFFFKFQYNFKYSNTCYFSWLCKIHNFQGQQYKSKIIKAMFMHIFIMTFNKLNNDTISVLFFAAIIPV